MTRSAQTMAPPDAAARRKAKPVLTYSVSELPHFDAAFYEKARSQATKPSMEQMR